jgi:hypothetical protein
MLLAQSRVTLLAAARNPAFYPALSRALGETVRADKITEHRDHELEGDPSRSS